MQGREAEADIFGLGFPPCCKQKFFLFFQFYIFNI